MGLVAIMFTALGTAIASCLRDFQGFQLVMNLLVMPTFFLSGGIFPLASAPQPMQIIGSFDPLSYGIDGIRGALIGTTHYGFGLDLIVLATLVTLFLGIGAYLFSRIEL
jgi:ABC-2 type transport system permease protein